MTRPEATAEAPTPTPLTELVDTMAGFWPGAEVALERGRGRAGARDAACLAEWALVPGPRSPQQLVPLTSPRAASRVLRRFSAAASLKATSARLAAATAVRGSRGAVLGHRVRVRGSSTGSLDEHLTEQLGRPVCWSLGIGPVRVNRKPVLQIFDERGRPLAFGKIGDVDSREDVAAEAEALARVGAQSWRSMEVPRLVSRTEWNGLLVVLMTPLATSPWQRPADQWHPPGPPMQELQDRYAEQPVPLSELPWTRRQREILRRLAEREGAGPDERGEAGRAAACLEQLLERAGDRETVATAWHGDWSPWNVARAGRDRWQVWDWERFEVGVPAGLDRQHWYVNAMTRASGESPASVRAGLAAAAAGLPDHSGALYLVAIATRYAAGRERRRGPAISGRLRLVVDELERLLR